MRVPTTSASSGGESGGGGSQPARAVPRSPSDAVQLADEPRALLFNARNAEDRDQFIDDLHEGIIEVRVPDRLSRSCLPSYFHNTRWLVHVEHLHSTIDLKFFEPV